MRSHVTAAQLQPLNAHLYNHNTFLLREICDEGGSTETFLEKATFFVLVWAYPHEIRTNNRNFKNAAILPR